MLKVAFGVETMIKMQIFHWFSKAKSGTRLITENIHVALW
jgi:hypothetical protein